MLCRTLRIFSLLSPLAIASALAPPAAAQGLMSDQMELSYASVRGWKVVSVSSPGGIDSCRAKTGGGYGSLLVLEQRGELSLLVPTYQTARFAGAVLNIDGRVSDRQVGFEQGLARLELSRSDRTLVMQGSRMTLAINGEGSRQYDLRGTTAAILKLDECWSVATGPQDAPTGALAPPPPPLVAIDGYNVGFAAYEGGQFRQRGDGSWVEEKTNGTMLYFDELGRDEDNVFLDDTSRDIQVAINAVQGIIYVTQSRGAWQPLYHTTRLDQYVSPRAN